MKNRKRLGDIIIFILIALFVLSTIPIILYVLFLQYGNAITVTLFLIYILLVIAIHVFDDEGGI